MGARDITGHDRQPASIVTPWSIEDLVADVIGDLLADVARLTAERDAAYDAIREQGHADTCGQMLTDAPCTCPMRLLADRPADDALVGL